MKVLLTGGTGYIGSHTAVVLMQAGFSVVLYDNLCNSRASVVDRLEDITGRRPAMVKGDIRDTALLTQTLQTSQAELVIHFAGLKAVGESVRQPLDYYDTNVTGTVSLLRAMRASHLKTLVFSSSATVYGQPQYLPIDEAHPTSATNPYGRTKLHIEEMLAELAASDPAWQIACLRYFNPVGAHHSGRIGENPQGQPNNLMPFIARVAAQRLPALSVFGSDYPTIDGTGVRDYIHVMDLAEGHLAALRYLCRLGGLGRQTASAQGMHTFNLGTGTGYSVLEMVQAFEAASGHPVPYRLAGRRSGDVASCFAQVEKAADTLHWAARRTLADMCASTWRFQSLAELSGDGAAPRNVASLRHLTAVN